MEQCDGILAFIYSLYLCITEYVPVLGPCLQIHIFGGRRSPAVACWASDHWVASSNLLRGKFRH